MKKRHGLLTVVLILFAVFTGLGIIANIALAGVIQTAFPEAPTWIPMGLAALGVFNLICLWAIFQWKKWGFTLFAVSIVITVFINLSMGLTLTSALGGLIGLAILYGALQVGGDQSGWSQLE